MLIIVPYLGMSESALTAPKGAGAVGLHECRAGSIGSVILTNRGAGGDTQTAWDFYRRVRPQFVGWNHVVLTFQTDPDRERSSEQAGLENKIVQFVDDGGNVLELEGINFGYAGHAPQELLENLMREGFCDGIGIRRKILNRTGRQDYPVKIVRSDGDLTI